VTLADLQPGQSAVLREIALPASVRQRLMELGFLRGSTVTLVRIAPLGDPLEIRVRGFNASLRRAEAAGIEVDPA
jgi:Fe2+ transport system protein FeoA